MRRAITILLAVVALLAIGACSSDRVEDAEGTVFLSVTDFDGLPVRVSVNNAGSGLQVGQIDIANVVRDPNGGSSDLMNVEMRSYEVRYNRYDGGTRTPPPLVRSIFGVAPANGEISYDNLVVMGVEQFDEPPLSDLLVENGGVDTETGEQVIVLEFEMRFFGRTISGNDIATAPIRFDVEFTP